LNCSCQKNLGNENKDVKVLCIPGATAGTGETLYISVFTYVNDFFANLEVLTSLLEVEMPSQQTENVSVAYSF